MSDADIGYADAMAELESILDDLEDDDLDVDVLASRVERASTLITLCRDRIGAARVQVEKVVASLDGAESAASAAADDETGDGLALDGAEPSAESTDETDDGLALDLDGE